MEHETANKKQHELERLKHEVLQEIKLNKNKKRLQWGSSAVTGFLALLIVFSIVQTAQSANILNKISSGDIGISSSRSTLPSSIQNLPDMVGGC